MITTSHIINTLTLNSNNITKSLFENNEVLEKISILFFDNNSSIKVNINWNMKKKVLWMYLYTLSTFQFISDTKVVISITIRINRYT